MVKIGQWIIDTDSVIIAATAATRLEKKYSVRKGTVKVLGSDVTWWTNTLENEREALENETLQDE